jgi:hypothetical protein
VSSRGANVTSLAVLEEFNIALALFASQTAETLQSVESEIGQKVQLLASSRQTWEAEVDEWRSTYDAADPEYDDVGYIAYKLEQAESNLRNICHWQGRVDEQLQVFRHRARRFQQIVTDENPKARAFVQKKLAELRDYVGLKAQGFSPLEASATNTGAESVAPSEHIRGYPLDRITEMSLPAGFEWVKLQDLDPNEVSELSELDYKKDGLGRAEMQSALALLKEQVLPEIQTQKGKADSDYFWQLDQQSGKVGINSLQGVYAAFFRDDAIWVDRVIGQRHFRIGNGRHRIKAALEAGWPAIPAKVMQASLRKAQVGP